MTGKYLITTDAWFLAPDGNQYKSAWGEVEIVSDAILGIKTNLRSTNWFAKVGSNDKHILIAGCQVHYACKSETMPNISIVNDYTVVEGNAKGYERPTHIYIAE